ncbi:MAG TPA: class I SAM-dependent methyltransferase [Verrucomicrobiae bacterium]|nr:class I SAM-dependent methyltransferase [Verrucomicrobiae bacterium]
MSGTLMIAPAHIPEAYEQWNLKHGAPNGGHVRFRRLWERFLPEEWLCRALGPFSIQRNNTTRAFEYPWAFAAGEIQPGMKVVEVGGSLAGFQFVLDRFGCQVVNVDPGMQAAGVGWPCDQASIGKLNRIFGTKIELRNTTMGRAGLADGEFDRVYCLSVIEHLPANDAAEVMANAFRCLKPGGRFILTVDLFLNITPFSTRLKNEYGSNQNVAELIQAQPWKLSAGNADELHGFPGFSPDKILCQLENYLVGGTYPALAQCLVLQKPG